MIGRKVEAVSPVSHDADPSAGEPLQLSTQDQYYNSHFPSGMPGLAELMQHDRYSFQLAN
jgi:hypothetical protein